MYHQCINLYSDIRAPHGLYLNTVLGFDSVDWLQLHVSLGYSVKKRVYYTSYMYQKSGTDLYLTQFLCECSHGNTLHGI